VLTGFGMFKEFSYYTHVCRSNYVFYSDRRLKQTRQLTRILPLILKKRIQQASSLRAKRRRTASCACTHPQRLCFIAYSLQGADVHTGAYKIRYYVQWF
jgi:hypothetical protein